MNKIQKIRSECTRRAKALASSLLKLRDAKGRDVNNATFDIFYGDHRTSVFIQTMTGTFPNYIIGHALQGGGSKMTTTTKPRRTKLREAGVREIARLTGYSNCYVCIVRQGQRKARPLRARMRELGLKFKEGK